MAKDYYEILGVSKTASQDEIKRAYRKLALEHHPDRGGNHGKFTEINEAYQVLSDPQKRGQYDQFGSAGFSGGQAGGFSGFEGFRSGDFDTSGFSANGGPASGWEFNFGGGLGDIFGDFFSSAFSTVQAQVEITPSQAVLGDHLSVEISGEKIDFEIPSGTQDGTQFRFRGKGRKMRNGQKGDLILSVHIKMPQRLSKEQKELWEKLREAESHKRSWWQG